DHSFEERTGEGLSRQAEKLDFKVYFADGKELSGKTFGFRVNKYGLCLFAVQGENAYSCYMVPHPAM
ncbi:MAG: hypothetical protein GWM98_22105, partial [Nitrospinaceae bacterium]|nr:hypothetical protein [Nitrospinaceae bacterium]NIU46159.1 hypothetical protein [Nitrospinaceae bacterium]NIW07728.1 hypothetical protein [Nitrospinaceae bacterium]NIX36318.1 hypothetical protein [Nitrospinaceae bacterium]NIY17378.1 hypothetical protein [Nitrospinaceae bacterium]